MHSKKTTKTGKCQETIWAISSHKQPAIRGDPGSGWGGGGDATGLTAVQIKRAATDSQRDEMFTCEVRTCSGTQVQVKWYLTHAVVPGSSTGYCNQMRHICANCGITRDCRGFSGSAFWAVFFFQLCVLIHKSYCLRPRWLMCTFNGSPPTLSFQPISFLSPCASLQTYWSTSFLRKRFTSGNSLSGRVAYVCVLGEGGAGFLRGSFVRCVVWWSVEMCPTPFIKAFRTWTQRRAVEQGNEICEGGVGHKLI